MNKVDTGTRSLNRVHELPMAEGDARLFISVAESGSFTAAAALYDITPSAVSKAVSRLENALGVRLVNRTTRALHLTQEGVAFHARCARAYQLLAEAAEEAVAGAGEVSGNVRLGVPTLFGTYLVGPRLPSLLDRHPRLRVEVVSTMRLSDLLERGLDFMIAVGPLPDSSFAARPLGYGQFVTVASPDYLRTAPAVSVDTLENHRCLSFVRPDGRADAWNLQVGDETLQVEVVAAAKSDDMHHLAALAVAGAGIAHVPLFAVATALESGSLVEVLGDSRPPPKLASFVYPASRVLSRRARTVMEHLSSAEVRLPGTRSAG